VRLSNGPDPPSNFGISKPVSHSQTRPELRFGIKRAGRTLDDDGFYIVLDGPAHWVFDDSGTLVRMFDSDPRAGDGTNAIVAFSQGCSRMIFWNDFADTVAFTRSALPYALKLRPACW
jgi:hypothetical protein